VNGDTRLDIKDNSANPAPLGLLAFGMTTVLLNLHNSGIFELNSMILAMGIFYGGLAQVVAGIMEWKKNNTFGLTAFASYGFFWLTLVALIVMPKLGWIDKTSETGMVYCLFLWGIFTLLMFFGTLKLSMALQLVFGTLALLFFLLAIGDATGSTGIKLFGRLRGNRMWSFCNVYGHCTSIERSSRKNFIAFGIDKKINI
jgi:succinate-acetate transporter protein